MPQTLVGRVIAAFGRQVLVRTEAGAELRARPFGRALTIVCGDQVRCRIEARSAEVHVLEVLPRRTALYRSNTRGAAEAVVANLTQLYVVLAPVPLPDLFVVDRYLAAATAGGIAATLIVNKSDLGIERTLSEELAVYAAAGYGARYCSADTGEGLAGLSDSLAPQAIAALVGQSGVGKSSLVRRLVPESQVAVGELVREEEGRHTTTAARLFDLPHGAALIDSPGVRDFAPAVEALDPRSLGFIEVERLAPGCRFADCLHMREPGCAVIRAAESGEFAARRYESYRRLRRLYEELGGCTSANATPPGEWSASASGRCWLMALPSSPRSERKTMVEATVAMPRTRNASCTPRTMIAGLTWKRSGTNTAATKEAVATPKLIDSCCMVLAIVLALLASASATSA
jgi:ribosome biogenesis GTPase